MQFVKRDLRDIRTWLFDLTQTNRHVSTEQFRQAMKYASDDLVIKDETIMEYFAVNQRRLQDWRQGLDLPNQAGRQAVLEAFAKTANTKLRLQAA